MSNWNVNPLIHITMTKLEITLIIIIWLGYGFYSLTKTHEKHFTGNKSDKQFLYVIGAPFIFAWRCIVGAFLNEYK